MSKHYLYSIVNTVTKDRYIGVSDQPFKRWEQHAEADSRTGRNMQEYGIECFSFSFIGAFPSRQDAERVEKISIEEEKPSLNGTHNPDAMPADSFGRGPVPEVKPSRHAPLQIDSAKLEDNEHFKILGEEPNKFRVLLKSTGDAVTISKRVGVNDMIQVAPLGWWQSLLGVATHKSPTSTHTLHVADSMTRIVEQIRQQAHFREGADGQNQAREILRDILAVRVKLPKRAVDVSVYDALKGKMKFIHDFGVRPPAVGDAAGLLIAPRIPGFQRLIRETRWHSLDTTQALRCLPKVAPFGKNVRFGDFTRRPLLVPEKVLVEIGLPMKPVTGMIDNHTTPSQNA